MIGIGLNITNRFKGSEVPFRFTINTNNTSAGSSTSTQFKLPLISGTLNAVVDWGDGTSSTITTWNQAEVTHTYAIAGLYDIKITGLLRGWAFNNGGDRLKILNVISWGTFTASGLTGFDGAFWGCSNMNSSATDKPLLLSGTLWNFFRGCSSFNGNIGSWDMSQVYGMRNFFNGCTNFNQNIGAWNVSNVTEMEEMFRDARAFNQNIGAWNVSNISNFIGMFIGAYAFNNGGSADINNWSIKTTGTVNMRYMFYDAFAFNQPLNNWNTIAVTNMERMFQTAVAFNQPLNNWNVSSVTNMDRMFEYANSFNQNIGNWNVSSVTNMAYMFQFATVFNQDIGSWNVSNVTNFINFMAGKTAANYSATNLNAIYNGWSSRPVQPNLNISFGTIKYTAAGQAGKDILDFAPNNWTIVDGGI